MATLGLQELTRGQLREVLLDAVKKLDFVQQTVRNIPEAHIPFPRLQEITFLEQRLKEYREEIARRWSGNVPAHVFYSYSRHDLSPMTELDDRLSEMRSQGLIKTFWDRRLAPGSEWHSETTEELQDADIVLFLVSPDFLISRYCQQVELPKTLELHSYNLARAIPIILRSCEWHNTPLGRLQAIPNGGVPVLEWSCRNEAWGEVARSLHLVIDQVRHQWDSVSS
jgi:hypothetical protein